jgi:hypothetical protein
MYDRGYNLAWVKAKLSEIQQLAFYVCEASAKAEVQKSDSACKHILARTREMWVLRSRHDETHNYGDAFNT